MRILAAAALSLLAGLANGQTLQARDIDGNGSIDAYYDSQQNISWLADANHYATLGGPLNQMYWANEYDPGWLRPGELRLQNAFTFLDTLTVAGVSGWRLPERLVPAGDPTGTNPRCGPAGTTCDPWFGWPTELTNMLASNPGAINSFVNVMNGMYLTYGAPYRPGQNDYVTWVNPYAPNTHTVTDETGLVWGYVWAVHDGDVGNNTTAAVTPVPEPETYALMLGGLVALALSRRRAALREQAPALLEPAATALARRV